MNYHVNANEPVKEFETLMKPTSRSNMRQFLSSCSGTYFAKRLLDFFISLAALLTLFPFLVFVGVLVRLTSSGPSLFWSERVGRHGQTFLMPKFRSMRVGSVLQAREACNELSLQMTPIGSLLRKLSIDELPQLWCVLRGDMSLVGPRPLLSEDPTTKLRLEFYGETFAARPGITGLAQINGRNRVPGARKARYDAYYAANCSLGLDLKILFRTMLILFKFEDIL
jgi:O-antigen biosynthesis protein WbqP